MATLTLTVSAGTDDAERDDTGYYDSETAMLVGGVGTSPLSNYGQGWRFTNVTLTSTDTINSAILRLMKSGTQWVQHSNRWTCINEDNTATFSAGSPPGSRAIVSTIVVDTSNVQDTDGSLVDFPRGTSNQESFGDAIADVLSRPGWSSGNALAVVNNSDQDSSAYENFDRKFFHAYESSTSNSEPQLVIDYTPGITYTRGDEASLPANDNNLETTYSAGEVTTISASNDTRVGQSASGQYMIHQFKDSASGETSCTVTWEGQSTLAPSASAVVLQVYNQNTPAWENLDSDNSTNANTDFVLTGSIPDLTNYVSGGGDLSCRVYQANI